MFTKLYVQVGYVKANSILAYPFWYFYLNAILKNSLPVFFLLYIVIFLFKFISILILNVSIYSIVDSHTTNNFNNNLPTSPNYEF